MNYWLDCYYEDEEQQHPLARLYFDGERIRLQLQCDDPGKLGLAESRETLCRLIRRMVYLALMRQRLRSRALPFFFDEVQAHSLEHFKALTDLHGGFCFSPLHECETVPLEKTVDV